MTSKQLNGLLNDKLSIDDFVAAIAGEVEDYGLLMSKRGYTINLRLIQDEEIELDKRKFVKLLGFVISGRLSNIHLAYICDCLSLADKLTTDDSTRDMIFRIADPEINGGYLNNDTLVGMVSEIR